MKGSEFMLFEGLREEENDDNDDDGDGRGCKLGEDCGDFSKSERSF